MPLPLLAAIPVALVAALLAYVKLHGAYIAARAATAAAMEFVRTKDPEAAAKAAIDAGASAATFGLVRDFFRGQIFR